MRATVAFLWRVVLVCAGLAFIGACGYAILFADPLTAGVRRELGTVAAVVFHVSYVGVMLGAMVCPVAIIARRG